MCSYYQLCLSVEPGGAKKDDIYIFSTLEEVMEALKTDLIQDCYLALWYGEYITLRVFHEGEEIWEKDLHPYLTFHVPGYLPLKCNEQGAINPKESRIMDIPESIREDEKDEKYGDQNLASILFEDNHPGISRSSISVEIDWAAIEIPPLKGRLAQKGEIIDDDLVYGCNRFED